MKKNLIFNKNKFYSGSMMFWLKFGHLLQSVAVNEAFKFHTHFEDR